MIILSKAYSDLKESKVVNVPAPAIIGKAKGTIVEVLGSLWALKISLFNIISSPNKNITIDPAIENDARSKPIIIRI